MSKKTLPDFLAHAHDERDPSPWLALWLDQSTPLPDPVKTAWLAAVEMVMAVEGQARAARQIADTARHTAALYLMQFQHITERMPHGSNP